MPVAVSIRDTNGTEVLSATIEMYITEKKVRENF
jgi:hypothetical protein